MVASHVKKFMHICSCAGFFMNLGLIPIICVRSGKDIGSYKYLLLAYTVVELAYSSVTFLAVPVFNLSELGWIYYSTTDFFPQFWSTIFVYAFSSFFAMLSMIITYSFLYRYFVFCKKNMLKWFSQPWRVLVLVLILFTVTGILELELYYFFSPNPRTLRILGDYVTDANLSVAGYMGLIIHEDDGGISWVTIFSFVIWAIMEVVCSSIILFVILQMVKSFRTIEHEATMSEQFRKLQKTLFTLLIMQTVVPFVFSMGPVGTSYIWPYIKVKNDFVNDIYSILLPISQVLDPILIVVFIRDYRLTFVQLFNLCFRGPNQGSNVVKDLKMSFMPTKNTDTNLVPSVF